MWQHFIRWLNSHCNQCYACGLHSKLAICDVCNTQLRDFSERCFAPGFINEFDDFQRHLPLLKQFNTVSIGPHSGLLKVLINQFKYQYKFNLGPVLAQQLYSSVQQHYAATRLPQFILPVPLHPAKRMFRGFNQTEIISSELALALGISDSSKTLRRINYGHSQASLNGKSRRKLASDTFQICDKHALSHAKHVALLDDVITTGSTLLNLIQLIKKANPDIRIDLWSLSVSLPHQ